MNTTALLLVAIVSFLGMVIALAWKRDLACGNCGEHGHEQVHCPELYQVRWKEIGAKVPRPMTPLQVKELKAAWNKQYEGK